MSAAKCPFHNCRKILSWEQFPFHVMKQHRSKYVVIDKKAYVKKISVLLPVETISLKEEKPNYNYDKIV